MRAVIVLLAFVALPACSSEAQRRWEPVQEPTSQPYRLDLTSLKKVRDILRVDVRSASGVDSYDIVRHEVRCSDLSVRLGTRRTYDAGTNQPFVSNAPASPPPLPEEGWVRYGAGSDGHHLAVAICSVARSRHLG